MKRMAVAATAAAMVLAACGGGGGEKLVADITSTAAPEVTTTTVAATTTTIEATTTTAPPAEMPDVVDGTLAAATESLRTLGVEDIRVTEVEHITQPGTVLDQVPSAGRTITGPVDLTVAKALAPMPDWTGKLIADAREYFEERGVSVTVEELLDDTLAEGAIVSSTPGAGQSVSSEIKLVVARTPVTLVLAELEPVEKEERPCLDGYSGGYGGGNVGVNGATQLRSVWFQVTRSTGEICSADFNLGRDWSRLKGDIGISDDSNSALQCRFEIFADGNPVFNQSAGLGQLLPIDLDISNVLRLRIMVTPLTNDSGFCVWATARLIGSGS